MRTAVQTNTVKPNISVKVKKYSLLQCTSIRPDWQAEAFCFLSATTLVNTMLKWIYQNTD